MSEANFDQQESIVQAESLLRAGKFTEALAVCRRLLALSPGHPRGLQGMGLALQNLGQSSEAIEALRAAAVALPDAGEIWHDLGLVLLNQGQFSDAAAALRNAIARQPNAVWLNDLGLALELRGDYVQAAEALERCVTIAPTFAPALSNLGNVRRAQGRLEEAAQRYQQAIAASQGAANVQIRANLASLLSSIGLVRESIKQYEQALEIQPDQLAVRSAYLLALQSRAAETRETLEAHRLWEKYLPPLRQFQHTPPEDRVSRPLKIAYVSGDFRAHSVGYFLENLLEHHDRTQFLIYCYADPLREDATTARMKRHAHLWRNTLGIPPQRLAELIHQDQIDIAVDLMGHTAGSHLLSFALKPAPIQVTYLGYPDTTGLSAIDYRFTDAFADPPGPAENSAVEKLVRLPHSFLCYRPPAEAPEIAPRSGPVQFASFNALHKISDLTIDMWARIFRQLPQAQLLLKAAGLSDAGVRQLLQRRLLAAGFQPHQLTMLPQTPTIVEHLNAYANADIALDTFPYHGTTTTCEALWMGLPVITLAGQRHASRVGVSILHNLQLPELIAATPEEYVSLAVNLANDAARRNQLRTNMRQRMRESPLMNAPQFARDMEAAYQTMWRTWVTSPRPPAATT